MDAARPGCPSRCATGLARALLIALLAPAAATAQTTEARDTVVLTNGKEVRGRVVRQDAQVVIVRVGSVDRSFPRAQVKSVTSVASQHKALMASWQDTATTDVKALLDLAQLADRVGLPHEARLLRWYAVLQRPTDAAIHQALGNRELRGEYQVELNGRWVPFGKADALGEDFANAWRLRSEHFTIQCSAGLRAGLDALMVLERQYWTFHELFGEGLGLLELVEPVDVRLYRTRAQMPNLSNNVGAYFAASAPALFTCMEDGRPFALVHESTHALLHYFFVRAAKSRGELPGWLDEGWAEYMEGRIQTRVPGKATVLPRSIRSTHTGLLADSRKDDRYDVHRLLNFKSSDFGASSRQDMKYAQAWALFRYLFEHKDPATKKLFLEYLQAAAIGQGQASTFRRLFAQKEQELATEPWKP